MTTGWRLSPSHNLLHTEGHPTLLWAKADADLKKVQFYIGWFSDAASSPPFYRVLSHRQEDGSSNEFCGFLRYMKQTPNFALSFYSYIRLG